MSLRAIPVGFEGSTTWPSVVPDGKLAVGTMALYSRVLTQGFVGIDDGLFVAGNPIVYQGTILGGDLVCMDQFAYGG